MEEGANCSVGFRMKAYPSIHFHIYFCFSVDVVCVRTCDEDVMR